MKRRVHRQHTDTLGWCGVEAEGVRHRECLTVIWLESRDAVREELRTQAALGRLVLLGVLP